MKQDTTIRIPIALHQELREYKLFTGKSINHLMIELITDFLATRGRKEIQDAMTQRVQEKYRTTLDELADK